MKRIAIILTLAVCSTAAFAQSEKYVKAMEALSPSTIDTVRDRDALISLANSFERIANAEKTQWLPYYYAAMANINAAYTYSMDGSFGDKSADVDPLVDKGENLLRKAEELSKDNSEIWVLKKMIATGRMMGNPMARYAEFGPAAAAALEKAKTLNPNNPRVYLLEGQDLFFTPEAFGGDKKEAKKRFETALEKFSSFKTESSLHPSWGKIQAEYLISQVK